MSFSSGIVSSVGISLGDLEIATDYLFANPEFYEPELTEVKSTISNKNIATIQRISKPIKPKITKEAIINKFSIVPIGKTITADEVVETSAVIVDNSSFDFSFDDMDNKQSELNEAMDEASLLMQRLAMADISTSIAMGDTDEIDLATDEIDLDIDESDLDDNDLFDIDDIGTDDNIDADIDIADDDIDIADDDIDIADDDIDIDIEDDIEAGIEIEDDIEAGIEIEDDIDSQLDIDIDTEYDDIDDTDIDLDIEVDDDVNMEIDIEDSVSTNIKNNITSEYQPNIKVNNEIAYNKDIEQSKEIEELKRRVHETELAMKKMLDNKALNDTSSILKNNNFEKVDSVDNLVDNATRHSKTQTQYNEYSTMTIDMLFKHVKHYMNSMGVDKRTVDVSALNNKFGEANIKKLIQKSYLIKIGKGVTTGR